MEEIISFGQFRLPGDQHKASSAVSSAEKRCKDRNKAPGTAVVAVTRATPNLMKQCVSEGQDRRREKGREGVGGTLGWKGGGGVEGGGAVSREEEGWRARRAKEG